MNLILLLVGLALCLCLITLWLQKTDIVHVIVFGLLSYIWIYIICAGLLLFADQFSVTRTAMATVCAAFMLCVIAGIRLKMAGGFKAVQMDCDLKPYLWVIVIIAVTLPLVVGKYGFYGMGQDEGVYQTEAIAFVHNKNEVQKDFREFYFLETDAQRNTFATETLDYMGLNRYDSQLIFSTPARQKSPVSYFFHAIPSFPALLALIGSVAGLEQMGLVLTICWILTILLTFMILAELQIHKPLAVLLTLLTAISPLMLWTSKSTLAEMVLATMVTGFLYCVLKKDSAYTWLSLLPVVSFCYFHLTVFITIPIIVIIYWLKWWLGGKGDNLIAAVLTVVIYYSGLIMMLMVSEAYVVSNFMMKTESALVSEPVILGGFSILTIGVVLVTIILWCLRKHRFGMEVFRSKIMEHLFRIYVLGCLGLMAMTAIRKAGEYGGIIGSARMLTLNGYLLTLGVVVPLIALVIAWIKPKLLLVSENHLIIALFYAFSVLAYAALLKKQIFYYYYYGRYLVPFIPLVVVFSAIVLNQINLKVSLVAALASIAVTIPYLPFFLQYQDDTKTTWDNLQALSRVIGSRDAVIINETGLLKLYGLPISYMTDALVYPAEDDWEAQAENIKSFIGGHVYYLGSETSKENTLAVYSYTSQFSEDLVHIDKTPLLFPVYATQRMNQIVLSRYLAEEQIYDFTDTEADFKYTGMGANEGKFAWTNGPQMTMECFLDARDYSMAIDLGVMVDLPKLGRERLRISVYMNDQFVGHAYLTEANNGGAIMVDIPERVVQKGYNELRLDLETWSPAEMGMNDHRHLCLGIKRIVFLHPEELQ